MTGIFKANNPFNNFLLFVYGLVLKLPMLIHPQVPGVKKSDGVLYTELLKALSSLNSFPFVYSFIAFLLMYLQALAFNKLLNDQRLFSKPNYLAGMSYLLITSLFTEWHVLSAPLIINTLLIWVLSELCNLYNNPKAKTTLFNVGMVLGLATLFYFPSIAFSLLVVVGLLITRPFKLPEWLIALVGLLTPYYFLGAWFFLTDRWERFRPPTIAVSLPRLHETAWAYTAIVLVIIIIAIGMVFIRNNMRRLLLHSRKSWSLVYLYLLVALLVPFLNAEQSFNYWILAAVPVSAFAAAAFLFPERKWFATFFHWALVALTVVMGYFLK